MTDTNQCSSMGHGSWVVLIIRAVLIYSHALQGCSQVWGLTRACVPLQFPCLSIYFISNLQAITLYEMSRLSTMVTSSTLNLAPHYFSMAIPNYSHAKSTVTVAITSSFTTRMVRQFLKKSLATTIQASYGVDIIAQGPSCLRCSMFTLIALTTSSNILI